MKENRRVANESWMKGLRQHTAVFFYFRELLSERKRGGVTRESQGENKRLLADFPCILV